LGKNGRILFNQESTAAALLSELAGKAAGQRYYFWHISSHAFHDDHSGHLSGLALYERDFWLDELWQLAPLPALVTFSACGGSKGHIIEGDEHIDLTTTCLTAGANHVIGSIWDISDAGLPDIMVGFYSRLLTPKNGTAVPVSKALAEAQRHAWKTGQSWQQWAGFRCTGRP
jgi:CHAT domain-containing protein